MRGDNNSEYFLIENHRHASLFCNGDLIVEETADPSENVIKEASFFCEKCVVFSFFSSIIKYGNILFTFLNGKYVRSDFR